MQSTTAGYPGALILAAGIAVIGLSAPAAKAADIKIGAPLALTGSLADEAKKQDVVWKMWLDKVNAAGGINVGGTKSKVQLVEVRLPVGRPARRATRRKAHHRRQGRFPAVPVRIRAHQDRRHDRGAL